MKTGYLIVDEMSHLTLSGNVIPNAWYQKIILPNGKAHLTAILILSDIVYWYRPTIERCPETGKVIGRKKNLRGMATCFSVLVSINDSSDCYKTNKQ
ncbi:hypothetical protein [Bacillus andreraoultii]|uniref:hypothetical protein n=1 Tax=Bacillus andreraoultii TaxID=1499685 RepID=UPI00067F375C|nr:hypothetical protein [Bacillus andreraoultii]